jgi:hypothetical protein
MLGRPGLIPDDMPVVVGFLGDLDSISHEDRAAFRVLGAVPAIGPEGSMRYVKWIYQRRTAVEVIAARPTRDELSRDGSARSGVPTAPTPAWTRQERFLRDCGIAVPRSVVVDRVGWRQALELLRFPLVAKALPEDVAHKTDAGLVELGIADVAALERAVTRLLSHPEHPLDRVLVQEMARPGVETLVAVHANPDFGPVLTVGMGGTLVELIAEAAHISIPCSDDEIWAALGTTRLHRLLADGPRGSGAMDLDAFVHMLQQLADGYLALTDPPGELELNPVVVHENGCGVTVLDILVVDGDARDA